jgi:hypothetical protein
VSAPRAVASTAGVLLVFAFGLTVAWQIIKHRAIAAAATEEARGRAAAAPARVPAPDRASIEGDAARNEIAGRWEARATPRLACTD